MTVHHAASRVLRQGLRAALVIGALAAPALAADSLEIIAPAGPGGGYDQLVIRGDMAQREFIAFWLKDGRVVGVLAETAGWC